MARQGFVVSSRTRSLELGAAGGKEGNSGWKLTDIESKRRRSGRWRLFFFLQGEKGAGI